ncbi:MAG: CpsD/CapB family tyrosine-protein kinase [Eubacterium sp.]|nr:CpsD/CapB family tyrosine-protein kinase [Eubacterium sp.]
MENRKEKDIYVSFDLAYMIRRLKNNALVIILCAVISGVGTYIIMDNFLKDTYVASINLAVVPRDNVAYKLSDYNLLSALQRSINVLNSDILQDQIKKNDSSGMISGTLNTQQVGTTNLLIMSASSDSAENAFRLLKAGIDNFPNLSSYLEQGYLIKSIASISADNITIVRVNAMKYCVMMLLGVLALGLGMTVVMAVFTEKIHNREQAEKLLDLNVLGTVCYVRKKRNQKGILINDKTIDTAFIEDIDKIANRICRKMDSLGKKTILITSVTENEGKSTVAVNLALSLAKHGKKIMLVDCDFRRPALAKLLEVNMDSKRNFQNYLNGDNTLKESMYMLDSYENLYCVLQKSSMNDPDKMLNGTMLNICFKDMEKYVDYVIVDTPPVAIVRDAEVIASSMEGILVVIKQDEIKADAVNDIVDIMEEAGAYVIGSIIGNYKSISRVGKNGYGKYYGYGKK